MSVGSELSAWRREKGSRGCMSVTDVAHRLTDNMKPPLIRNVNGPMISWTVSLGATMASSEWNMS